MSSLKQTCQEIWWSWGWKNILKCLICNQTLFMKKRKSMSTFNSVDLWFNCPPLAPCMVSAGLSLLCWSLFGISGPTPDWRALISPTHPLLPLPLNWSALRVCSGWWREGGMVVGELGVSDGFQTPKLSYALQSPPVSAASNSVLNGAFVLLIDRMCNWDRRESVRLSDPGFFFYSFV